MSAATAARPVLPSPPTTPPATAPVNVAPALVPAPAPGTPEVLPGLPPRAVVNQMRIDFELARTTAVDVQTLFEQLRKSTW